MTTFNSVDGDTELEHFLFYKHWEHDKLLNRKDHFLCNNKRYAQKFVSTYMTLFIFFIVFFRDLKAENLLLGPDGLWKLCDFGSTSTNHKRFEKAEEMGIEEDNIRKYTTPAYRAPEVG